MKDFKTRIEEIVFTYGGSGKRRTDLMVDQLLQLHIQGVREIIEDVRELSKEIDYTNPQGIMLVRWDRAFNLVTRLENKYLGKAEQRQKLEGLQPKE